MDGDGSAFHHKMVHSAREMLSSIDGPSSSSGSLARLILARTAVEELSKELEVETAKKLHLEGLLAHGNNSFSVFSGQDVTGKTANGIAETDESSVDTSTTQIIYEDKVEKQLPPDPPFVHSDPPSPNGIAQPLLFSERVAQYIPDSRSHIQKALENDPMIFSKPLETQLHELVTKPLLAVIPSHFASLPAQPVLKIIDGLGECTGFSAPTSSLIGWLLYW
ncbi:hypothetical protein BDZ94DRAFT_1302565 [Collybia nuda]|uniref:Uncharacterized protein n=1 Tax=Collybia nuda TaxID=64659 RepID=A0A9P6CCW0_9AGAR|nr:hypothetical protein BDZ94DRAFT_1302565 [Collybia nuda]